MISPGFACHANLHGASKDITLAAAYTFIWNVLMLAVGSMPITLVKENEQIYESKHIDLITT